MKTVFFCNILTICDTYIIYWLLNLIKMKKLLVWLTVLPILSLGQEIKSWSLQEMVNYASENNLSIKNAKINNKLLENNIISAQRQKLPSVNANIDNSLIIGVSGIPITNSNQQFAGKTNGYQLYQNNLGVGANMTLFNKGRFKLDEEKARIDLAVSEENILANINDISLNIANNYLNVLLNRELASTAQEQLTIAEQQLERNEILYKSGAIPLSQVYEARSNVASQKQQLANAKINIDQAKFNLVQLLQLDDYRLFDVEKVNVSKDLDAPLLDMNEIIDYAYTNQPVIKSSELNVLSAEKDIEIAKTNYWPTVTANYNIGTNYRDYLNKGISSDALFNQWWDNHSHSISLGVNIPIFNKFATDLNVENAKIRVEQAQSQIDIQKQALKQDIQAAYFLVNSTYEQYLASKEAVKSAELAFEFAEKSFKAGRINIFDFNQSSTTLFNAKSQMLQAKYNYIFRSKVLDFYAGKPLEL